MSILIQTRFLASPSLFFVSSAVVPTILRLHVPDYLSRLSPSTHINILKFSFYLYGHPHRASVDTLLTGLTQSSGFQIGYKGLQVPKEYSNLLFAWVDPSITSSTFEKRCKGATWLTLSLPLHSPTRSFLSHWGFPK